MLFVLIGGGGEGLRDVVLAEGAKGAVLHHDNKCWPPKISSVGLTKTRSVGLPKIRSVGLPKTRSVGLPMTRSVGRRE